MSKPVENELTKLKKERIARLERDLDVALHKEAKEAEETTKKRGESIFGFDSEEGFGFGGWRELPSLHIKERIRFLRDSLERKPIPDNMVGVDGGITKAQFQQNIRKYVFHTNPGGNEVIRGSGLQIPSLDGIELPILFRYGGLNDGGYVNEPKTQQEFNALKTSHSGHSRCNVEFSRCGIRILGSVKFPPFAYTINLSDNDITSLNGVNFGRCVEINLARNFISSLRGCRFLEGTTTLDLRDNNIKSLTDINVRALPRSLERIILDGNPIMDNPDNIAGYESAIYNQIFSNIKNPPPLPSAPLLDSSERFLFRESSQAQPQPSAPELSLLQGGVKRKRKSKTKRKKTCKAKKTNNTRKSKKHNKLK